ncbi:MAG: TIGR04002 family protein [Oscillospiraceae bacterium]|nr:TIGR04002 family protein [Oscillospiraceae bacterium]
MKKNNTKYLVLSALFAAIITVCTRFTAIPIFGGQGYVHIGDAFVFLSAAILPTPYAMITSAIGGGLADMMAGYTIYILPTALIKALMSLMFFKKTQTKLFSAKSIISSVLGTLILIGGYYIAEVILFGSFVSPLLGMLWNALQGIFSSVAFLLLAAAFDKAKLRDRFSI